MIIILFIPYALALLKQETYEYEIGQMITKPDEDFLMTYKQFSEQDLNPQSIQISDKIGQIGEINHHMNKIVDMKLNIFEQDDCIWILHQIDNKSILSQQSIADQQVKENYHLHLDYECQAFYFISKSQIVIDCQDSISNIIVLFDISHNLQQSYFYSQHKQCKFRKLLQLCSYSELLLVQQELFLVICLKQNKYQICDQFTYQNYAHYAYLYQNQIFLISDYTVDVFDIIGFDDYSKVLYRNSQNFSKFDIQQPIKFYLHNQFDQTYIVFSDNMQACFQACRTYSFDNQLLKIHFQDNHVMIQTQSTIYVLSMKSQNALEIKKQFNDDLIVPNILLDEFYIANHYHLIQFGVTSKPYLRILNQTYQINKINNQNYYTISSFNSKETSSIIFDEYFQFKKHHFNDYYQSFFIIGGLLDIKIDVEESLKGIIIANCGYFLSLENHENVFQFQFIDDLPYLTQLIIIKDGVLLKYNLVKQNQKLIQQEEIIQMNDFKLMQKIQTFREGYVIFDSKTDQKYFIFHHLKNIQYQLIDCDKDYEILDCTKYLCICISDKKIRLQMFEIKSFVYIEKDSLERLIRYDRKNSVLYLINGYYLIIKYYSALYSHPFHSQKIKLCQNFINLALFQLKLILICAEQMILYNKISNYRFVISGNIQLFGQEFTSTALLVQTKDYLYYVIDNQILHVFNSNLPLSQQYVTKLQISEFDEVKVQDQYICFLYNNNLQCYYFQINIKFSYDHDLVEFHQLFKVNICAQNQYEKKCRQYLTQLDQQNRRISIINPIQRITINKNTNSIKLDHQFYSGSVDKIYINNKLLKIPLQKQDYIYLKQEIGRRIFYQGLNNMIYIIYGQQVLQYNIESKRNQSFFTQREMKYVLNYKDNMLLIGHNSISQVKCQSDCVEYMNQNFDFKISQRGVFYIHNHLLYARSLNSLKIYNLDANPLSLIYEEPQVNMIDISVDRDDQICMIYTDFKNNLTYKYQDKAKRYNITESLQQIGIHLGQTPYDAVHSIIILDHCKLIMIHSDFGSHFFKLEDKLIFISQLAIQNPIIYQLNKILIGKNYLFYTQQQKDSIFIFKFTCEQIYNSKYIDFRQKLDFSTLNQAQDYLFHTFNDELYLVQSDYHGHVISLINLDIQIQFENIIDQGEQIQITLSNSEESKSFILELAIEGSNYSLLQWIILVMLFVFYIYLLFQRKKQ